MSIFSLNQSQKIIFSMLIFFLLGSIYLFTIDSRYNNPDYNENWFALSFVDAKSDKLDFTIENYSTDVDFSWKALHDANTFSKGTIHIESQSKQEIFLDTPKEFNGKITIEVSSVNETREIYRHLK